MYVPYVFLPSQRKDEESADRFSSYLYTISSLISRLKVMNNEKTGNKGNGGTITFSLRVLI